MPAGRPTDYRPEYCEQVLAWGNEGKSVTWMAAQLDVNRDTIYEWERVHPEFSDALSRARLKCQAWWEDQGQTGLMSPAFNGSVWAKNMGARFKDDWSDAKKVELTGKDGGAVQSALTIEFVDAGTVSEQA